MGGSRARLSYPATAMRQIDKYSDQDRPQYFEQDLRKLGQAFTKRQMGILDGTFSVEESPEFQAASRGVNKAYGMAREQALESTPVGASGLQQRAIQQNALAAAEAKGSLVNAIANQILQNQLGLQSLQSGGDLWAKRYGINQDALARFNQTTMEGSTNWIGKTGKGGGGGGGGGGGQQQGISMENLQSIIDMLNKK